MNMKVARPTRALSVGAVVLAAMLVGWQEIAAADAGRGHGMRQMQELMDSGNPGMARMHERMMQDEPARRAHDSMMQVPAMAEMHETMTATVSPGS